MAMVLRNGRAVKAHSHGHGGQPSPETLPQQIEGHAMGVIAETGFANKHTVKAVLFDRMGDNAREQLWSLLETMEEAHMEGDGETLLAGFQVIRQHLRPEIERLDRLEGEEYRYEATGHVASARREGRSVLSLAVDPHRAWPTEA